MQVLVRVAPEIVIKSSRVRARFLRRLCRNMGRALDAAGISWSMREAWSRIFVEISAPEGLDVIRRVFGVGSVSPVEHACGPDRDEIGALLVRHYASRVAGKTYCVRVKRTGLKNFSARKAEVHFGTLLFPFAGGVDLTQPEIKIDVEVRPEGAWIFSQNLPGPGGLPLGVEGRALCLISGGFDSAVAVWLMMKRGLDPDFLFCNLAGSAYENAVLGVTRGLMQAWGAGSQARFYSVDFQPVVEGIRESVKPKFSQVVLKRSMMKVGCLLAERLDLPALVTGEALGQVSSQTLHNLAAIEEAAERPVLRPLIGSNKEEIIRQAREIGTFELSEHIPEYCSIAPRFPVTRASVPAARAEEEKLDQAMYHRAVEMREQHQLMATGRGKAKDAAVFYTDEIPADAVVLDCRTRAEYQAWHYPGAIHREPEELFKGFSNLDKNSCYVLYCPFGLQTAVLAEKMQESGMRAWSFRGGSRSLQKYLEKTPEPKEIEPGLL